MMSRPVLATDRAALILELVPYLVGKGEVSVVDAAAEFDVSPEDMRAIVRSLTVIGLPGETGFWQMPNDLFDIDWDLLDEQDRIVITNTVGLEETPRLTAREAAALLAGLQLTRSVPGLGDSAVLAGLLAKLARGASSAPADVIVAPAPVDDVRVTVADAVRRRVAVSFDYRAPDAPPTRRTVDPIRVHIADGQWYLQGWCHLREANRTFHLDRVAHLVATAIPVSHVHDPLPELFAPGENDVVARVRFPAASAPLLGDYLTGVEVESRDGIATARLRVADAQGLKRLAARLGGTLEILDPPEARAATAAWAQVALEQYR